MRYLLLLLCVCFSTFSFGQVVINEISSAQNTGYADEDGEYPDWIELYNKGTNAVNLEGYKLLSREGKEIEWTFPIIYIQPGEYLTVFASGKDRKMVFDHWGVPVYPEMIWKYFVGTSQPPNNWNLPTFNDALWLSGQGGIGYGDGDDSTVISPAPSCYLRTSFVLPDTSNIAVALLAVDYDDAFVAYLNGVELKRSNIGVNGIPPMYNELAYDEHEAQEYQGGSLEFYFIDNDVLNAAKDTGLNTFSIEVHNYAGDLSDLTIRPYLLLGMKDTTVTFFPFPVDNINLHTNFNISSSPFRIKLLDNNGTKIDEVFMNEVQLNNSRGRTTDGAAQWCIFKNPTPDTSNATSNCYSDYAEDPVFTLKAGFYNGNQTTQITTSLPGNIYFTTDGNTPTSTATNLYTGSIAINSNSILKAKFFPSNPNLLPSRTISASYFINENIKLPIISITTAPDNLWSHYTGIYVMGPYADSLNYPFLGANFWMGWEKEAHIEYFDRSKNRGFDMDVGLKIHGNYSKSFPQRSFRILAKDDYNEKWINYSLFPEKPYIRKFKNFNIRNSGIDFNTTHFRDAFMQRVVRDLRMDYMAYEPCVLFLNGQYWGVYGMRERQDDRFIYNNHSEVKKGSIDYLRFSGNVIEGSNTDFLSLATSMVVNDLSIDSNYNKIADSLDVYNFADYYITETYYGNVDWLTDSTSNNIKFWRVNNPVGKWKYVLWDTDLGTGLFGAIANLQYDYMGTLLNAPDSTIINPHVLMFRNILDNMSFKNYFINRYADLINTTFLPARANAIAQSMADDLEPEMARHFNKWGGAVELFPSFWLATSIDVPSWKLNVDTLMLFMDQRPAYVRNFLETDFSLIKQVDVTLKVQPAGAGLIHINTITPEDLPWTGVYFDGVPVTLTVLPNPGYVFDHWGSITTILDADRALSFKSNVASNDEFTAFFNPIDYHLNVFPNPANNVVNVSFGLPNEQQLSIKILSTGGKVVAVVVPHSSFHPAGQFTITFTKQQYKLAAGTYFIEFKSDTYSKTIKFTML